jgi:hypothetical protein
MWRLADTKQAATITWRVVHEAQNKAHQCEHGHSWTVGVFYNRYQDERAQESKETLSYCFD